jgi:hypothetical protein
LVRIVVGTSLWYEKGNILGNVSTRLQVKEKSTYVDGVSRLSGMVSRD